MARYLAIDWDTKEARYVVASTHGSRLAFESAGTLPIESPAEGADPAAQLGASLRTTLAGKANRASVLVGIDRGQIDLVTLTLPPASDAELPEMVRHQAMRENSAITDDAVIDFVPAEPAGEDSRKATAVALASSKLQRIQNVLSEASLSPTAIALRPYSTGAMVLDSLPDRNQACLVVNVIGDEIDLIALTQGHVVYWRTLRQADVSRDPEAAGRLLAEIQRTLLVAQPQLAGTRIADIYLCGGLDEHPALTEALASTPSLALTLVDPFANHGEFAERPEQPGPFASLVGMLSIEAHGRAHTIDFLHPRKPPTPPDRRRTYMLAGAAAGLVVLLGLYQVWSSFSDLDGQIDTLSTQLDDLKDQLKRAKGKQKAIQAVADWKAADVNWLDELRDLSLRFPSGRDAVVMRMGLSQGRDGAGSIDMVGIVRDPIVVSHIENNLRDKYHQISSRHMQQRQQNNNYSWHFESSLVVEPREPGQYSSHLPADQAAEKPADDGGQQAAPSRKSQAAVGRSSK